MLLLRRRAERRNKHFRASIGDTAAILLLIGVIALTSAATYTAFVLHGGAGLSLPNLSTTTLTLTANRTVDQSITNSSNNTNATATLIKTSTFNSSITETLLFNVTSVDSVTVTSVVTSGGTTSTLTITVTVATTTTTTERKTHHGDWFVPPQ
jgi:hypothetical protein